MWMLFCRNYCCCACSLIQHKREFTFVVSPLYRSSTQSIANLHIAEGKPRQPLHYQAERQMLRPKASRCKRHSCRVDRVRYLQCRVIPYRRGSATTKASSVTSLSPGSKLGTKVVLIPNVMTLLGRLAPPVRQRVPGGQSLELKWSSSSCLSHAP